MGASLSSLRKRMRVERSPHDKGSILTIRVRVYDNGVIDVDGRPVEDPVGAVVMAVLTVQEFLRQTAPKQ